MANAYSQPQKGQFMQTYVSQHVPMPFETIQRAIAAKNAQADAVAQYTENAVTAAGNIKALQGADTEYVMAKQQDLNQFVDTLVGKDLTDPEVVKAVRHKVGEFNQDQNLSKIQGMYKKAEQLRANIDDMKKNGHYNAAQVHRAESNLKAYISSGGFTTDIDFDPAIEKGVDSFGELSKYYSQLKASGGESMAMLASKDGNIAFEKGWSGISGGRITQQHAAIFDQAFNSQAGQQVLKEYEMIMENSGKKPTKKGAMEYFSQQLMGAGQGLIHGNSTISGKASAYNKGQDDEKASKTVEGRLEEYATTFMKGGQEPEFDDRGQLKGSGSKTLTDQILTKGIWEGGKDWWKATDMNQKEAEAWKPIAVGAKATGMTPKEYYEAMNTNKSIKTQDFVNVKTAENASKIIWNKGGGNWHSMNVIAKDGTKMSMAEFVKETTGIDPDEDMAAAQEAFKASGFQISGELDANPYVAKGAYGNIGKNSFIIDYSHRASSEEQTKYKVEKIKAEGVLEEKVREGGKSVIKLYIWDPLQKKIIIRTPDSL